MDMKVHASALLDSREFSRMTRAIEFIEREYQRQPKLAQIARHVGLSEFHFNRLFRRWTGLTPKQYLAEVTSRARESHPGTSHRASR
jgi:AraC family transcriptional regulator, regulatory protein of adaptative response / methylated-DNA-[protein]-cysteine methyltransferase